MKGSLHFVKFLIPLAALLMIPIIARFQTRTILEKSNPDTLLLVQEALADGNVSQPQASIEYLDVSIEGVVKSEKQAALVAERVNDIRGVRLAHNRLVVQGWLEIDHLGEQPVAQGLVPSDWAPELFKGQPQLNREQLETRAAIQMAGENAVAWGLLIDELFQSGKGRTLALEGNRLRLAGEITPLEREALRGLEANLGREIVVEDNFALKPSRYHFQSHQVQSPIEGEPLRSLRQRLADCVIEFPSGSSALSSDSRNQLTELASWLITKSPEAKFVIGSHPANENQTLDLQRATSVKNHLSENGVASERMEIIPFEMTEDGSGLAGQVEILIR
jgi:hypothetical protein